jgi:hypothetical protein
MNRFGLIIFLSLLIGSALCQGQTSSVSLDELDKETCLQDYEQLRQNYASLKNRQTAAIYVVAALLGALAFWRLRRTKSMQMSKAAILQIIILVQSGTLIALGIALMLSITASLSPYNHWTFMLSSGGIGGVIFVALRTIPQIFLRLAIAGSVFWWLDQQKKMLQEKP